MKREKYMNSLSLNSIEKTTFNNFCGNMAKDEGENFLDYLIWLGLIGETNLLVLSLRHQYYFDHNDLKDLRVLVILKKLNLIKHLDSFLHVVFRVLPPESYFIGCFTGSESSEEKRFAFYQTSTNFNKFLDSIDSKTDLHLVKNNVYRIFESHGFKIVDMTEINKQVYFVCQKKRLSV